MKKYRKYRIRHNKGLLPYKVQRKIFWLWKTIYTASSTKDAITYIKEELLFGMYTNDDFLNK